MKTILKVSSTSLRNVHIACRMLLLISAFFVNFTVLNVIIAFGIYLLYFTVAQSIMMHRYYSHRMFEFKYSLVKWLFVLISMLSLRGSPIGWAYIHRLHHENTDNDKDPHSPHFKKFNLFELGDSKNITDNISLFKIKNILTVENIKLNDYYWAYALAMPVLLLLIDLSWFYFGWLLPVCFFQICTTYFNYANHSKNFLAYRNFNDGNVGESVNSTWLWVLSLGECWHNNHHRYPGNLNFRYKWWEMDPSAWIIQLVKK